MNKYLIFRALKKLDKDVKKHELVSVEYGKDIDAVTDDLIRAIVTDLSENPEYANCEVNASPPEPVHEYYRTKRYSYYITGIVMPPNAVKNTLVDYGIIEMVKQS